MSDQILLNLNMLVLVYNAAKNVDMSFVKTYNIINDYLNFLQFKTIKVNIRSWPWLRKSELFEALSGQYYLSYSVKNDKI